MHFFDFLYFILFKFYSRYKEKGAESTSAGIIGGFQTLNLLSIIMLLSLLYPQKVYFNKLTGIALFLIFQIYTYIKYTYIGKYSIKSIEERWLLKPGAYKKKIKVLCSLYCIISLLAFFGIALYLGNSSNEGNKPHSGNFDNTGKPTEVFSNIDPDSLNLEGGKRLYMLYCSGCHNLYHKKVLLYRTQKIPLPYFQKILIDTTKNFSDSMVIKHVKFFDLLTIKEIKEIKVYLDCGGVAKGGNL